MPLAVQLTRSFVLRFAKQSLVFAQSNSYRTTKRALFVFWTLFYMVKWRNEYKKKTPVTHVKICIEKNASQVEITLYHKKHFHIFVHTHTRSFVCLLRSWKFYTVIIEARHSFHSTVNNVKSKLQSLFSTIEIGTCTRKHAAKQRRAATTPSTQRNDGEMHSKKCHVCGNGYEVFPTCRSVFNATHTHTRSHHLPRLRRCIS